MLAAAAATTGAPAAPPPPPPLGAGAATEEAPGRRFSSLDGAWIAYPPPPPPWPEPKPDIVRGFNERPLDEWPGAPERVEAVGAGRAREWRGFPSGPRAFPTLGHDDLPAALGNDFDADSSPTSGGGGGGTDRQVRRCSLGNSSSPRPHARQVPASGAASQEDFSSSRPPRCQPPSYRSAQERHFAPLSSGPQLQCRPLATAGGLIINIIQQNDISGGQTTVRPAVNLNNAGRATRLRWISASAAGGCSGDAAAAAAAEANHNNRSPARPEQPAGQSSRMGQTSMAAGARALAKLVRFQARCLARNLTRASASLGHLLVLVLD